MKRFYNQEYREALLKAPLFVSEPLTEDDMHHLPALVQKYLRYTGAVGKEKVYHYRVICRGLLRSKPEDSWMKLRSEQLNTCGANPTRIFFIKAFKMGIPALGVHLYKNSVATMNIKLAGLWTLVDAKGPEMDQGETATVFAEMCYLAPAALIDPNIQWKTLDETCVQATFTNGRQSILGYLFFNPAGELVHFSTNDRYDTDGKCFKQTPWFASAKSYRTLAGLKLTSAISLIYQKPEGEFCYGVFEPIDIQYNVS